MPRLTAAEELLSEEEPLELPHRGKVYVIQPLDAFRWLRLMALDAVGMAQLRDTPVSDEDLALVSTLSQRDVLEVGLGAATLEAMVADDVDPRVIEAAGRTAGAYHRYGLESARRVWEDALANPRTPLPGTTPRQRRPPTSPPSPSTA